MSGQTQTKSIAQEIADKLKEKFTEGISMKVLEYEFDSVPRLEIFSNSFSIYVFRDILEVIQEYPDFNCYVCKHQENDALCITIHNHYT